MNVEYNVLAMLALERKRADGVHLKYKQIGFLQPSSLSFPDFVFLCMAYQP